MLRPYLGVLSSTQVKPAINHFQGLKGKQWKKKLSQNLIVFFLMHHARDSVPVPKSCTLELRKQLTKS